MSTTPSTRAPKQPQDHQQKTNTKPEPKPDGGFTFEANGKTYSLPVVGEDAAGKVPFKYTRQLVMNPDDNIAQMAQTFALLDAVGADPEAIAALESLPTEEAVEITGGWVGESRRSAG